MQRNLQTIASLIFELSEIVKKLTHIRQCLEKFGISKLHNYTAAETLLEHALDDVEVESDEQREERMC